jgi:hypothetical protein
MDTALLPRKMPYIRFGYAVTALLVPKVATLAILGRPGEMTPTAVGWAALFASREAALGAVTLESERLDPATRKKALLLNAAVDGLDSLAFLALGLRRRSILPLLIVPVGVASAVAHIQAAQQVGKGPGANGQRAYENAYASA